MMRDVALLVLVSAAACGSVPQRNDGGDDDAVPSDAAVDALPMALVVLASPSSFNLHANDTRETKITVINNTTEMVGVPTLQVTGLTLGTLTFSSNTCTAELAPGASCSAVGTLTASTAGQVGFAVAAMTNPGGTASAMLSINVMGACPGTCGPNAAINCCESSIVPGNATGATLSGATYYRSYDVAPDSSFKSMMYAATVSDFRLDKYEVTVGRFRAFVNAGFGVQGKPPAAGAGAHPKLTGSGWNAAWNSSLPADRTALETAVKCNTTYQTWTDVAGNNESLPINCMNWYLAMAFCIWDGGYLPTEAEWNYAASGGSEQRAYPWSPSSSPGSTTIDCSYANYGVNFPSSYCVNGTTGGANRVGSESPKGDGKWGHSDLAGNVYEWVIDFASTFPTIYPTPCDDCAQLMDSSNRIIRGKAFLNAGSDLRTGDRTVSAAASQTFEQGVRCARLP
jgi:sulfatase modifying factor 1